MSQFRKRLQAFIWLVKEDIKEADVTSVIGLIGGVAGGYFVMRIVPELIKGVFG